jgi:hypothetical protein
MTTTITTQYRTDPSGKGKVTAKADGKQRTVSYDPSRSVDYNHGAAAGALLRVFVGQVGEQFVDELLSGTRQEVLDNGRQRFTL